MQRLGSRSAGILPAALLLGACATTPQEPPPEEPRDPEPSSERARPPERAPIHPIMRAEWEQLRFEPGPRVEERSILTASGSAEVEVRPDRARLSLAVETEAETARAAGEENAGVTTAVAEAVARAGSGLPGIRVETGGYLVTPRYGPGTVDRPREIVGYTARNTLRVTVDDVEAVGRLIDAGLEAGANRVSGVAFEIRDPEPHRHHALRRAVEKAHAEARVMAEALGMGLGPAVEVEGGADFPSPRPFEMEARVVSDVAADRTPIDPGLHGVSARVTIRFALEAPEGER